MAASYAASETPTPMATTSARPVRATIRWRAPVHAAATTAPTSEPYRWGIGAVKGGGLPRAGVLTSAAGGQTGVMPVRWRRARARYAEGLARTQTSDGVPSMARFTTAGEPAASTPSGE